jgi:hypothetical protein
MRQKDNKKPAGSGGSNQKGELAEGPRAGGRNILPP